MGNILGGFDGRSTGSPVFSDLRSEADTLFKQRKMFAQQSQEAYRRGDMAGAKALSMKAKDCERKAHAAQVRRSYRL